MFGSLDLGYRARQKRVTGTSGGWLPACHLRGKLHRTCIADIGWCLTFVSAPPIGYDPRAEDLRKHVLPAHHRHTGTCNRPDNITPLASLVRVDSGKSAAALVRGPVTHCTWLQQKFVKGRAQSCSLIRTPPTECPAKDSPISQTARRPPASSTGATISNVCCQATLTGLIPADSISVALM